MIAASVRRYFVLSLVLTSSVFVGGCESQLPSPLECESMAITVLGRTPLQVSNSPAARRWVAKMANACLTTPFDRDAVRCLEEQRNLPYCMKELALRAPELEPAIVKLLAASRAP